MTQEKHLEPSSIINEQKNCLSFNFEIEFSLNNLKNCDVVAIDEAQFFPDLYEFVKLALDYYNKHVIVIGLDGDSDRNNFGDIHRLLPLCDDIIKLKALCSVCKDGSLWIFSKKIVNSSAFCSEKNNIVSDNYKITNNEKISIIPPIGGG